MTRENRSSKACDVGQCQQPLTKLAHTWFNKHQNKYIQRYSHHFLFSISPNRRLNIPSPLWATRCWNLAGKKNTVSLIEWWKPQRGFKSVVQFYNLRKKALSQRWSQSCFSFRCCPEKKVSISKNWYFLYSKRIIIWLQTRISNKPCSNLTNLKLSKLMNVFFSQCLRLSILKNWKDF